MIADIAAAAVHRRAGPVRVLEGQGNADALPDRRGWAALLTVEQAVSTPVGDPVGVVLVDLGVLRTMRSLRRAVSVVREAAGDVTVARVGPR